MTRAKRKTTTRKRKTRKKKVEFRHWLLPLLVIGLMLGVAYVAVFVKPTTRILEAGAIESVLLGAELNLERDVTRKENEHIQHWRIQVKSKSKQVSLERALEQLSDTHQAQWVELDRKQAGQTQQTLYVIRSQSGTDLHRILFVLDQAKRAVKPKEPKPQEPGTNYISQNTLNPDGGSRIAIIIDDVGGHGPQQTKPLTDLNLPITFAVIPFLAHSTSAATHLHQSHYEVMLHMPMEPGNYPASNPGEGAILAHMNGAEIQAALNKALRNVPFVSGVNNHMGSKITANRALMREILQNVKSRDLFFVDSRTHKSTVAYEMAQEMGVRSAERKVFLDTEESYDYTVGQIEILRAKADELGQVIAIGHPYDSTIQALVEWMPKLDREGYEFVFASDLVAGPEGAL